MPIPVRTNSVRADHSIHKRIHGTSSSTKTDTDHKKNDPTSAQQPGLENKQDDIETSSALPQRTHAAPKGKLPVARAAVQHARGNSVSTAHCTPNTNTAVEPTTSRIAIPQTKATGVKGFHSRHTSTSSIPFPHSRVGDLTSIAESTSNVSHSTSRVMPTLKPQFNNYQQHFSPKKPKQPTAKSFSTIATTADQRESADAPSLVEDHPLKVELLQLALVYEGSEKGLNKYKASIRSDAERRYGQVALLYGTVSKLERDHQQAMSTSVLKEWLLASELRSEGRDVQVLSNCIEQLELLINPSGQLTRSLDKYEVWFRSVTEILRERQGTDITVSSNRQSVPTIGQRWASTMHVLQEEVRGCLSLLETLPRPLMTGELSTIEQAIDLHCSLARFLLKQMDVSMQTVTLVMRQEENWITDALTCALSEFARVEQRGAPVYTGGIWDTDKAASSSA